MVEQLTGRNIFHVFGGVSELSQVREGRIRSQASFSHPILAGTFAATLIPLFIAMWKRNSLSKRFAVIGILAALVMIYACASSGPIFSLLAGLCVVCMWPLAPHMRKIRWIILLMLGGLQLMMKSPIYSLIARVPMMSGSTGGYRYMLLDAFFRHFKDWALVGIPSTWYWGEGLVDVTNHYIRIAVDGGLFSLLLFLTAIGFEFRQLGIGLRVLREKKAEADWFFMWCLGAALFSHLVSFISVSYFDQVIVPYYMVLAMIPALSHSADLQPAGVSAELRESMSLS
jgi:hypothetical protein